MDLVDANYDTIDGRLHETFIYEESVYFKKDDDIMKYIRSHTVLKVNGVEVSHDIVELQPYYVDSIPALIRRPELPEFITEDEMMI